MHYLIGGEGDPIVLLHGWPQTWYEWRLIIPILVKNNHTVIMPDLRGLGDTSKPSTGYDDETTAEDIYQLVIKKMYPPYRTHSLLSLIHVVFHLLLSAFQCKLVHHLSHEQILIISSVVPTSVAEMYCDGQYCLYFRKRHVTKVFSLVASIPS
jgi:esterase/lipase